MVPLSGDVVSSLPPDQAARERALDPTASFCVRAPAGSGKTELLIQRYLRLLATVERPEEIVAITFTRKAAAEMAARVTEALAAAAAGTAPEAGAHHRRTRELAEAALARDRERGWELLRHASRMRIDTIDALCLELVHRLPLLARLGTATTPTEEAAPLYREAARRALGELGGARGAPVERLLLHLAGRPELFVSLVAQLLGWRDQAAEVIEAARPPAARAALERVLEAVVRGHLAAVAAATPPSLAEEICACGRYAAHHLAVAGKGSPVVALEGLSALPGTSPAELPLWHGVAALLLTAQGAVRRPGGINVNLGFPAGKRGTPEAEAKRRMQALVQAVADHPAWAAQLATCRSLPSPAYDDPQWGLVGAAVEVVHLAAAHLWLLFRERGVVDFPAVALEASAALGRAEAPGELLLAIDREVRHLLVDEFQDTSRRQLDLLERLTAGWEEGDGRTLFLVGDPMQSIYRFRQAEVALFLRTRRHGLGSIALTPLTLSANFRSDPAVVGWVNRHLGPLFPDEEDEVGGAVPYAPSTAARPAGGGTVQLHPLVVRERREAEAAQGEEAHRVVELVAAARERGERCAVLVRARSHLPAILAALHRGGHRYQARDVLKLVERPVVLDLVAFTRALLSPLDRTAWLALLRAPFCGLDAASLYHLCDGAGEAAVATLLADGARLDRLDPGAARRAARLGAVMAEAEGMVGRRSLARRVEGAWLALGGPATVGPGELAAARAYLRLLRQIESEGALSVAEVERRLEHLFAPPDPEADGTLAVMTIHKAKGLEFDTVILPGLGRAPRAPERPLLRWLHLPEGPLLAARPRRGSDPIYDFVGKVERAQAEQEVLRLLYVATTRARRHLHLLGTLEAREGEPPRPARGSLFHLLWEEIEAELLASLEEVEEVEEVEPLPPRLQRLPDTFRLPTPAPALTPSQALPVEAEVPPPFRWAGEVARHTGSVVHATLARIATEGVEGWDRERVAAMRPALRGALATEGVGGAELEAAVERAVAALEATVGDPRGRWLLARHPEAGSEVALAGLLDGQIVHCTLDRTFVDGGVRWIVDYKIAAHEGGDLEGFLAAEWERYRPQLARYATLMARLDDRPIRIALYHPLLGGWREAAWQG